jgi:hypothetical protein
MRMLLRQERRPVRESVVATCARNNYVLSGTQKQYVYCPGRERYTTGLLTIVALAFNFVGRLFFVV